MAETRKKSAPAKTTAMSARLLELNGESVDPEPYEVTDTITVQPLTRTREKALHSAELKKFFASALLSRRAALASLEVPPAARELPEDATDEERAQALAEHESIVEEWKNAFDIEGAQRQVQAADEEYERAFFGDAYDAVIEFFEDRPRLWNKFLPDIQAQFLPKEPDPAGDSEEERAGKGPESST
jgi:hypothetical protein